MANKTPPVRTNALHTQAGVLEPASEATAIAAGDTIIFQNNGNVILRCVITTGGTGTIVALNSANNQALTLSVGTINIGPLDPAIFGSTVTITTATAVGSCALYASQNRFFNGLRNPFETNVLAADSN